MSARRVFSRAQLDEHLRQAVGQGVVVFIMLHTCPVFGLAALLHHMVFATYSGFVMHACMLWDDRVQSRLASPTSSILVTA